LNLRRGFSILCCLKFKYLNLSFKRPTFISFDRSVSASAAVPVALLPSSASAPVFDQVLIRATAVVPRFFALGSKSCTRIYSAALSSRAKQGRFFRSVFWIYLRLPKAPSRSPGRSLRWFQDLLILTDISSTQIFHTFPGGAREILFVRSSTLGIVFQFYWKAKILLSPKIILGFQALQLLSQLSSTVSPIQGLIAPSQSVYTGRQLPHLPHGPCQQ